MGLVSMATTRPQAGHLKAAASVPSPGSWRSSKSIWASQSTQRNFITRNAEGRTRNSSSQGPELLGQLVPGVGCRVPGNAREQRHAELGCEVGAGGAGELAVHHVLDDAQQR